MSDLPGLDLAAVATWLSARTALAGPLVATPLVGGRSNLTYLLDDGERRLVLRRPPLGHVLATAHDMAREHRVLSALTGTAVPVPDPVALCEDPAVTGAPFLVMSYVEGRVLRTEADLATAPVQHRDQLAEALVEVLADLHDIDPSQVALGDFGRPGGFLARQVTRWGRQLAASRSRGTPDLDELASELGRQQPAESGAALVHGDYRLDNLVVAPNDLVVAPRAVERHDTGAPLVRAVLDWEMSTLGDPLTDLGLLLVYWGGDDPLSAAMSDVAAPPGAQPGMPSGHELAVRYARRTGRDVAALPWYVALASFKLAVVLEGIHYRYTRGQTVGEGFERIGALPPLLARAGLARLRGH